jgi:hypothetical protein
VEKKLPEVLDSEILGAAYLLFYLKLVYDWAQLRQDLVCLLVELELRGDELSEISKWFGGVENLKGS